MRGRLPLAVVPLLVAGCGGNQNVLHGQSHQERSIDTLWWVMFGVACAGFTLVGFLLLLGWLRRNRRELPGGGDERVATGLVVGYGYFIEAFMAWYGDNPYEKFAQVNRMFGPYRVAYWALIASNVAIPQLLWLKGARSRPSGSLSTSSAFTSR